ncbi:hypothetical protein U472_07460 [Orenia metallireducens]|uniref:N-acetyltransferase domain-containing protein n=1 Tax=Orenia metallireducens TaxID=1413210 RepID=A0A1C0AAH9_9FIRM|nr:GNAT family N-acetyltransferase [Orenia metallireducens]OCL27294.1 hypothetical protein U472_07460 [Orenia metallireducens]
MNLIIQEVSLDQIDLLLKVAKNSFVQTYQDQNNPEDMADYLERNFNKEELELELKDENSKFFIACLEDKAVGYFKLSFNKVHKLLKTDKAIKLERLYLLQSYIGRGIGKELMFKAIEVTKNNKVEYLWLGVWKENQKAIAFYQRWGFKIFSEEIFFLGEDAQEDWLMKKRIEINGE